MSKPMTQKEYLATHGEFCPFCREPCNPPWEIVVEPDGYARGYKHCKSKSCDRFWDEEYVLTRYLLDEEE